jgi:hypothetical protein
MSNAKLLAITVERFKSFAQSTRIELAPLTIILGRHNSGKSTLIQSLLLLKQTLRDVNPEVMLRLDGTVDAFNLRELTFGWPAADDPKPGLEEGHERTEGPTITVEWECDVDIKSAIAQLRGADLDISQSIRGSIGSRPRRITACFEPRGRSRPSTSTALREFLLLHSGLAKPNNKQTSSSP